MTPETSEISETAQPSYTFGPNAELADSAGLVGDIPSDDRGEVLPRVYRAILTDEFTLRDNPLATRDSRRDARHYDRLILALATLAALWASIALAAGAVQWYSTEDPHWHGIPSWIGGSYGTMLFVVLTGVHAPLVYVAGWRRTHPFFLREYRQNSLAALLGTRTLPFQLVLQASTYPFVQAMEVAALGIPFYVFAWSLGGVSVGDLLGGAAILAMIAFRPPRWRVPVFRGLSAEEITKRYRKAQGTSWTDFWMTSVFGFWMFGQTLLSPVFGINWLQRLLRPLWMEVPKEIQPLVWSSPISWVVAVERLLCNPFPFYSFVLPPFAAVLLLYPAGRLLSVWLTSFYLRVGTIDQLARLWDWRCFARANALYGTALGFFILGYLWQPYVATRMTSALVSTSTNTAADGVALAGLLWLLGSWAAVAAWFRAGYIGRWVRLHRDASGELAPAVARQRAVRFIRWYILLPPAQVAALYLVGCLLGREAPLPLEAAAMAVRLVAVTATGALLIGLANLRLRVWPLVWVLPLAGWGIPNPPVGAWIASLSPLVGPLSLTPHTQRLVATIPVVHPVVPAWWMCVVVQVPASCILGAMLLAARRAQATGSAHDVPEAEEEILDEEALPEAKKRVVVRRDQPAAQRLIAWVQARADNAVLIKELRVGLRGHLGRDELIAALLLPLAIVALALHYSDVAIDMLGSATPLFFGAGVHGPGQIFAGLITLIACLLGVVVPVMAAAATAAAFVRERDRSTLGFILVTPVRTSAIVFGKLAGMLAPSLALLAVVAAWNTVFLIATLPFTYLTDALAGWAMATVLPALLTVLSGIFGLTASLLFRRESDAGVAAAFALIVACVFVTSVALATDFAIGGDGLGRLPSAMLGWIELMAVLVAGLAAPCLAFATWRLTAARHGDVAFETARR